MGSVYPFGQVDGIPSRGDRVQPNAASRSRGVLVCDGIDNKPWIRWTLLLWSKEDREDCSLGPVVPPHPQTGSVRPRLDFSITSWETTYLRPLR